ncbi:Glycerophosphocholine phosphodiesterase, partial [Conoideocrella luteorostrata]
MRFGRDLHIHRLPDWTTRYIDYDGLKLWLKSSRVETSAFTAERLELHSVERFLATQIEVAFSWIQDIFSRFSLDLSGPPFFPSLQQANRAELQDLQRCLLEHSSFVSRLDMFSSTNRTIVRRILAKARVSIDDVPFNITSLQLYTQPWIQLLKHTNHVLQHIEKALLTGTAALQQKSIVLEKFPMIGQVSWQAMQQIIIMDDNNSDLRRSLSKLEEAEQKRDILDSLVYLATLHRAPNCAKALLEFDKET